MTRYFISADTIAPYSQIIDYMIYILSNSQESILTVFFSWIQKILSSNPELVYMCDDEWLAVRTKLISAREYLETDLQELLSIIQRHHFNLVGGSLATIDGGPAVYGIKIPVHLHQHLER